MQTSRHLKGFAVLGVAIALSAAASMGAGILYLTSSNTASRNQQVQMSQSFYSSVAGLEYARRVIATTGSLNLINQPYFGDERLTVALVGGKIKSTAPYKQASAVLSITQTLKQSCVHILNTTAANALTVTGAGIINATNCTINVNSSSLTAVTVSGSAKISADEVKIVGNYRLSGLGLITSLLSAIQTGATAKVDPYLTINVPTYSTCNYTNRSYASSTVATINPGVYCGGLSIGGNSRITFNPGTYIIDGSTLAISNSAVVTANDVTIILSGKISGTYARLNVTGAGVMTLKAPTTGTYANLAIIQDRNAPTTGTNTLSNSANLSVTGAIYIPNQLLTYSGGLTSAPCTQLVVNRLAVSGSSRMNCPL